MENPLASQIINWIVSDLFDVPIMGNQHRPHFVERLVTTALGEGFSLRSADWAGWDIDHESGVRIEVKQSAARQPWTDREGLAGVCTDGAFDIRARTGYWDGGSKWIEKHGRHAHLYIFAWHPIEDKDADHRRADQWRFFVVPESELPAQKTIGRRKLESRFPSVGYSELRGATVAAIDKLAPVVT
jgi:hypothetical protein